MQGFTRGQSLSMRAIVWVAAPSILTAAAACSDVAPPANAPGVGAVTGAGAPAPVTSATPQAPQNADSPAARPHPNAPEPMPRGQAGAPSSNPPAIPAGPSTANAGAGAAAGAGGTGDQTLPQLCSGCSAQKPDPKDTSIHLHHVHMNVADPGISASFYEKHLGAKRVLLNDTTEALQTTPVLLLLEPSKRAPVATLPTALQHVGWGAADVGAWFDKAHANGVAADTRGGTLFNTFDKPTIGEPGDGGEVVDIAPACFPRQERLGYIYVLGPDDERIEVWSGADARVNHVHFTTADLKSTAAWYNALLGVTATTSPDFSLFYLDDILFFFEPVGTARDYAATDDHVLGHIAFSVTDLDAWLKRTAELKLEVVAQPAPAHGFESFFVRGPDGMLIELVKAQPHAGLCPDA